MYPRIERALRIRISKEKRFTTCLLQTPATSGRFLQNHSITFNRTNPEDITHGRICINLSGGSEMIGNMNQKVCQHCIEFFIGDGFRILAKRIKRFEIIEPVRHMKTRIKGLLLGQPLLKCASLDS